MTIKKKAKQLALTLIGEDQNPQPLIDLLVEMAEWQMKRDAVPQELVDAYWELQKAGADAVRAFINTVNGYSAGKGQAVNGLDEELEKYYEDNGMFTDGSKVRRYNGDSVDNTWDYADVARHFAAWQKKNIMSGISLDGWVARDENGSLHLFEVEPSRIMHRWWDRDYHSTTLDKKDFPDLEWEDEPVSVKLIIIKKEED